MFPDDPTTGTIMPRNERMLLAHCDSTEDRRVQAVWVDIQGSRIQFSYEALTVDTASGLLGACCCEAGAKVAVGLADPAE